MEMTPRTAEIFRLLVKDAPNWSNQPLWGGNFKVTKKDRGNLTDLKHKGLVTTFEDEGCIWVSFTKAGVALAEDLYGADISD